MLKIFGNTVQNVVALTKGRPGRMHPYNNAHFLSSTDFPIKRQEGWREPGHPVGLDWTGESRFDSRLWR